MFRPTPDTYHGALMLSAPHSPQAQAIRKKQQANYSAFNNLGNIQKELNQLKGLRNQFDSFMQSYKAPTQQPRFNIYQPQFQRPTMADRIGGNTMFNSQAGQIPQQRQPVNHRRGGFY